LGNFLVTAQVAAFQEGLSPVLFVSVSSIVCPSTVTAFEQNEILVDICGRFATTYLITVLCDRRTYLSDTSFMF
jgi:hypothetical protein